jgi:hypothetical protein
MLFWAVNKKEVGHKRNTQSSDVSTVDHYALGDKEENFTLIGMTKARNAAAGFARANPMACADCSGSSTNIVSI